MSDSPKTQSQSRPWHLWVVGGLTLLLSGFATFDYIMTATKNEAYLADFPPATLDYYFSFPLWVFVLWAVGNLGGMLGGLLLLVRKVWAIWSLAASAAAAIIATFYTYAFKGGLAVTGMAGLITSLVFLAISVLVVVYARRMKDKGVLC